MISKNSKLNKENQKINQKNKLSRMKEKIVNLDSDISELYKIYSETRRERVDKEKNEKNIINRINYLIDEEKKMRIKCQIQMEKINKLSQKLAENKKKGNFDIDNRKNKSLYINSKNHLNDSKEVIVEEHKNKSVSGKNSNKEERKLFSKYNLKANFPYHNNRKKETQSLEKAFNNNSVFLDRTDELLNEKNLFKETLNIEKDNNKYIEEQKRSHTLENRQKNKIKKFSKNKTLDSNSNKNKKGKNKIIKSNELRNNNNNIQLINKKDNIDDLVNNDIDFKIGKIVIMKKKNLDNNEKNNYKYKFVEDNKQNENIITYDYVINKDKILYSNNHGKNLDLLVNNSNKYNINQNYIYMKNEEKLKNIIINNKNDNDFKNDDTKEKNNKNASKKKNECQFANKKGHVHKCIVCSKLNKLKGKKVKK